MRRYLIVANQTLGGEQLTEKLDECQRTGPCRFFLAVPITQTEGYDYWGSGSIEGFVPNAYKVASALAEGRLRREVARLRKAGADADGEVVEPMPVDTIRKLAEREQADEIIVSTLPRRLSRWMVADLPHRIKRATGRPMTHIAGAAGPSL
jgi:nucleotide-binding universal stress UspA family protein